MSNRRINKLNKKYPIPEPETHEEYLTIQPLRDAHREAGVAKKVKGTAAALLATAAIGQHEFLHNELAQDTALVEAAAAGALAVSAANERKKQLDAVSDARRQFRILRPDDPSPIRSDYQIQVSPPEVPPPTQQ